MENEKVKEIKDSIQRKINRAEKVGDDLVNCVSIDALKMYLTLINELESENERLTNAVVGNLDAYRDGFTEGANLNNKVENKWKEENKQLKDQITELEDENERLKIVVDIANERTYRKKFIEEWRKEYQKELDKQGEGHIAGFPDFDLVYKLYFEQKDRLAELEDKIENGTLVEFPFCVFDKKKNKEADCYKIALKEDWAKCLCYCDMNGFAIAEDGMLILLDECGRYTYCRDNRFKVVAEARLKELQEN